MSELIISVSGLRGIVGESLTPEVAARYASAFAAELPAGPIVITRDGRASGPMLAEVLSRALTVMGRNVVDASVAATPTTGVLVRQLQAAGGIQNLGQPQPGGVQRVETVLRRRPSHSRGGRLEGSCAVPRKRQPACDH